MLTTKCGEFYLPPKNFIILFMPIISVSFEKRQHCPKKKQDKKKLYNQSKKKEIKELCPEQFEEKNLCYRELQKKKVLLKWIKPKIKKKNVKKLF
jgi:hypothetical protein